MTELNFDELKAEITGFLEKTNEFVLATSHGDKVTARTVNPVSVGTTLYIGTSRTSTKFRQLTANPNIALATGYMQIEATAAPCTPDGEGNGFTEKYNMKFPHLASAYPPTEDDVWVKCVPEKIALYKYIDGGCWDVLDLRTNKAYRE